MTGAGTDAFRGDGTTTLFGDGDVRLWAGSGATTIWGGTSNDVMAGNGALISTTIMMGGAGNGIFLGGGGTSTAHGGMGNDTFYTGSGTMTIYAGAGQDMVLGRGVATIPGGSGQDIYTFSAGSAGGSDVIDDFKVGVDHIDLFGYAQGAVTQDVGAAGLTLTLSDGTDILLSGVTHLAPDIVRM